eukprot:TRINITY_DN1348_c0_g1_i1.p1 TRINITY_DN1348_c0_g1~~TRINITY_DN1348_c0_g1_i1.p1  ORF type:complete len:273 (-),score=63.76 TRINITY_DN1348_c0_g1_i1:37-855(-)
MSVPLILERVDFVAQKLQCLEQLKQQLPHLWGAPLPASPHLSLPQTIDHTILKPNATRKEIETLCEEAHVNGFKAVCVNPARVEQAVSYLASKNSKVLVASVVGFPLGAHSPAMKAAETREVVSWGAREVDMVINIGALLDGDYNLVLEDISAVVKAAKAATPAGQSTCVKVILETCLLTPALIVDASLLSILAGADFVKTSTGFSTGGATAEHVKLMKTTVGNAALVKASGGVRDLTAALTMLDNGASRIGTSSGLAILNQSKKSHLKSKL